MTTSRRVARVQDELKKEVSRLLLLKTKDPRLGSVSVTAVKMTPDLKRARVYYSLYDPEADREEVGRSLARATGFFRREVGRALGLKFTPEIIFELDQSLEYAEHIERVLQGLRENRETQSDEEEA